MCSMNPKRMNYCNNWFEYGAFQTKCCTKTVTKDIVKIMHPVKRCLNV